MENKIIHGDVRDYLDQIPEDAFIISDPPYNQKYHYSLYDDDLPTHEYTDLLLGVFKDRRSVVILYPEETINLLGGGRMGKVDQVVSWVYPSNTEKQSRLITWWNCKPDVRKVGQPYKNPNDKRIKKRIAEGKMARLYDWWEINQVKKDTKIRTGNPHSCPIPDELARRIILTTTEEGDLVVDPFCGSGTICRVAKENNRRYLGFDIDETYVEYSNNAINANNQFIFS